MTDDTLAAGAELFGYTIERPLGRGGMGTVYQARQRSLDRRVALKVLHPARTRNPKAVEDFFNEAKVASRLHHPHLVSIHDFCSDPG
jgi:serine/threonine-protein kinase PpkA